ncbi:aldehyde dehydrogenase family protein [Amycolatopsis sp. K13G38]|uniref:Aldehyde dehydrogenase family protein n=1 Tax=Amycolatopsis acididurans TaxID=2724524 RepID=A0ABX1J020_9PSEU|nr:aldehyde dehydrogenase family protein [Amycolatopsis acididurans]NKQ51725.1 aldehyde dehydrogenase family protein [Amycolatopsis acididurans]
MPVHTRFEPAGDYRLFLGGQWRQPAGAFEAIDPSTGKPWAVLGQASAEQAGEAVAAARTALRTWRRSTVANRQRILWQIADRIEADPDRWARLLATENGRPIREASVADVPDSAAIFRFFSGLTRDLRGDQVPVEDPHSLVYSTREPLGVVAAVLPWNSPLITLANKIAPALAAGNTVVVKPSEFATASVLEFCALVEDLLPPGVLNVVSGGPETGAALVSHPDVALVTLTGGGPTARRIMAGAASALTPSLMELGGKGALIVAHDADLDRAVTDAVNGIYLANGEACVAASRLLLHESIAEEFLGRFAAIADSIRVGDALDESTQLGPLVSRQHHERVLAHLARARTEGVRVLTGDAPVGSDGFFVRPTLLHDTSGGASVLSEEIFGPVTVAETFTGYDDAVARANNTPYGLAAGVWTADLTRAHLIARELDAGIVWVNKWFDLPAGVPMGGVKASGFGRELCWETLLQYSAAKVVNIGLGAQRVSLWG